MIFFFLLENRIQMVLFLLMIIYFLSLSLSRSLSKVLEVLIHNVELIVNYFLLVTSLSLLLS